MDQDGVEVKGLTEKGRGQYLAILTEQVLVVTKGFIMTFEEIFLAEQGG